MWMVIRWRDTHVVDVVQVAQVRANEHRIRARAVNGETFLVPYSRAWVTFSQDAGFPVGVLNTEIAKWEPDDES